MKTGGATRDARILAIDVRPHWFGYAIFEAPMQLLDFGLSGFSSLAGAESRFVSLATTFRPGLVILRRMQPGNRRGQHSTKAIVHSLRGLSYRFSIRVKYMSDTQLRHYFRITDVRNKQQMATLLARTFPELSWKLPAPRKRWQHEHKNMPIFDGVELGMAYFVIHAPNLNGSSSVS
jgi:hypothetical protein